MTKIKLNKQQKEAVEHNDGPLMIIAGAGTGKTTVITERVKYLLANDLAKTSEILALTFTEKAAQEMEERVDRAMPLGYGQMWISTFHSFCDRVLRQEGLAIGIDTSYNLLTTAETMQFLKDNLFEFELEYFRPLGNPTKFIGGLLGHFSRLQDEDIAPSEYSKWATSQVAKSKSQSDEDTLVNKKWLELADAYKTYEELKLKNSVMDFGDLISKTLALFRNRKNILREYQERFKYILVDEYQDTNIAQNELVKLLCEDDSNITVVLDDDQSIYRFRGAAVSNAIQFRDSFPKLRTVTLTQNYRSNQEILDKSYDLIQFNNPDRLEVAESVNKKLVSKIAQNDRAELSFIHTNRVENEADEVAKRIIALHAENYSFKDMSILVRANSHAEPFVQALKRHGIPHQFLGPAKLFEQREILELIAYLKILDDVTDNLSLYTVLTADIFHLKSEDLNRLTNEAKKANETLYDYVKDIPEESSVSESARKTINKITLLIERHLDLAKDETAGRVVYSFLEETDQLAQFVQPDTSQTQEKVENIAVFFDKLKSYEAAHDDARVSSVVDWIEMLMTEGESPRAADMDWSEVDAVNILTVHSSKGLEFPIVFLVNLVALRFPSINRREQIPIPDELIKEKLPSGDYHLQEERRLFYVGMTRAKQKLFFTAADYYGEGKRAKKLSPFIFEALGEDTTSSHDKKVRAQNNMDIMPEKVEATANEARPVHVDYLSYTQISTFQTCPLHYKLRYVLKIPTEPTAPLSFGKSIHEVMRRIYTSRVNDEMLTKKQVIEVFEDEWVSEGYTHKKHEQEGKEKGRRYIEEYYQQSYKKGVTPAWVEHPFVVSLRDTSEKGRRLKIGGKVDRVDHFPQGGFEIIDYKTGEKVPSQKDVDKNEQLTFYALAASKLEEYPFDTVKVNEIKLSLYYFEGQQKITTTRTKAQLKEFEKKLFDLRDEIEKSDFQCSNDYFCQSCEYKSFCIKSSS